jgi:hypothetical protein
MQNSSSISLQQLKRLQTLYSQFAREAPDPRIRTRQERLLWASFVVGHPVTSFSELSQDEANTAIAQLEKTAPRKKRRAKPMSREAAERHAKDGRWDGEKFSAAPQIASEFDLANIAKYYARLGWDRDTFDRWLRSPRSPLGRRSQPKIVTVAQANRVRWALKKMLQARGLWKPVAGAKAPEIQKAM